MSMIYDEGIFQKFRALAVTKVEDMQVGKTYYSNDLRPFTVKRLLTMREHYIELKISEKLRSGSVDDIQWLETTSGETYSLSDRNVGDSYNPWLIFESKEVSDRCREELVVTYVPEEYDFMDYECYYDDQNDYEFEDEGR